jgi:serine/threonine-protein phosphatase CPPED1
MCRNYVKWKRISNVIYLRYYTSSRSTSGRTSVRVRVDCSLCERCEKGTHRYCNFYFHKMPSKKRSSTTSTRLSPDKRIRVHAVNSFLSGVKIQANRTLNHPFLQQQKECSPCTEPFTFVVGADTQFGIITASKEWTVEKMYSEKAVAHINSMVPKPAFVSMCGDLVDMEAMMFEGKLGTKKECLDKQSAQYDDFEQIWSRLDPEIPLICLCGNHDVGNRPTVESIERFTSRFGDDYLAFWCRSCYMICLNSSTYFDPTDSQELHQQQKEFLEERLQYAKAHNARRIFLFSHHPWFLYSEDEDEKTLTGINPIPGSDQEGEFISDSYFPVGRKERAPVMELCRRYGVSGCFAGHYHQNLVSRASWGMPMIVTAGLCGWGIESTGKDRAKEENQNPGPGVRVVDVSDSLPDGFTHRYEPV